METMKEKLVAFIEKLKTDNRINSFDEAATKQEVILQLLFYLAWEPFNTDEVRPEYSVSGRRVDYSLRINHRNKVFVEVKKVGEELAKHQEQLLDYSFKEGVKLAVLTNGVTWWFYLPLQEGSWERRKFYTIDVFQQETERIASKFIELLYKENINSGKAIENAETIYKSQQKQNILKDTLPKAWNSIITEPDELLVELINEKAEKLCGYKADDEIIKQFLFDNKDRFSVVDGQQFTVKTQSFQKKKMPSSSDLSRYGHRLGSMSALIDEMLWEGTTKEAAINTLMKQHGRTERLAKQKFLSHVSYLPGNRGVTVNVDEKTEFYKAVEETYKFKK